MLGEHFEAHLMVTLKYRRHNSMGAVFQERFKFGASSTHLVDSANHVFLVP